VLLWYCPLVDFLSLDADLLRLSIQTSTQLRSSTIQTSTHPSLRTRYIRIFSLNGKDAMELTSTCSDLLGLGDGGGLRTSF